MLSRPDNHTSPPPYLYVSERLLPIETGIKRLDVSKISSSPLMNMSNSHKKNERETTHGKSLKSQVYDSYLEVAASSMFDDDDDRNIYVSYTVEQSNANKIGSNYKQDQNESILVESNVISFNLTASSNAEEIDVAPDVYKPYLQPPVPEANTDEPEPLVLKLEPSVSISRQDLIEQLRKDKDIDMYIQFLLKLDERYGFEEKTFPNYADMATEDLQKCFERMLRLYDNMYASTA